MSTLNVTNAQITTLKDASGGNSSIPADILQGRAKAWFNLNGTGTPAFRDSFNCASLTDNGTGDYTVNFTTNFADTNYATIGSCAQADVAGISDLCVTHIIAAKAVGSTRMEVVRGSSNAKIDEEGVDCIYFGDQ